jgi:hypothetical protein
MGLLQQMRDFPEKIDIQPMPDSPEENDIQREYLRSMVKWRMSKGLHGGLAKLVLKGVDVPWLYVTFRYSGTALLKMLDFYRVLQDHQCELRKKVTKEKRSIRSLLRNCRRRFNPATMEAVEIEANEILDSLNLLRHLLASHELAQKYRKRLGIHRKSTKPIQQDFWRVIIRWTVERLREQGSLAEKEACQIVARLLHAAWPKIGLTPEAVKARYYRTL